MTALLLCVPVWMALTSGEAATGAPSIGPIDSPYDDTAATLLPAKKLSLWASTEEGRPNALDIWYPEAPGSYPVFFFMTGLNGAAPPIAYDTVMEKVAARGIIVVLPFVGLAGPEAFKKQGGEFAEDIAWMRAGGLARALADQAGPQAPAPDLRYVVASGHSSGGKAIVELYRKIPQQVAGVLLLEPVEIDPANMSPPCLGEGDHFDLGTPLLVMATGLGEQPGVNLSGVWPPCAPVGYSGLYFYDHFGGPKWYVKAEDYGHADILGNFYLSILQLSRFCKSAAHLKPDRFRTFVAGLIAAFIRGPVMGDARMLPYLEDEWSISLDVLLMHE